MKTFQIRLSEETGQLAVGWSRQPVVRTEEVSTGVELGFDVNGRPVQLSVAGLDEVCASNAMLAPMIRCGDAQPMQGKDGTLLYYLALSPDLREQPVVRAADEAGEQR